MIVNGFKAIVKRWAKRFFKRLNRLKMRLEKLVNCHGLDEILHEIIKKMKKQRPRVLTSV